MNNSLASFHAYTAAGRRSSQARRLSTGALALLAQTLFFLAPCAAAETTADPEAGHSILFFLAYIGGIIGISVFIIVGLTRWGHKQDQIRSMMPFCIRYLVESKNEPEKIEAARALGKTKDPSALLILIDVINDEKAGARLHGAAIEALQGMSKIYSGYSNLITDLLAAVEESNHQKTIDLLTRRFERQSSKKYVQSAYVISREYMRMKNYSDARNWLQKARLRNRKTPVYVHQISQLITSCNQHLFNEGDVLFKVGEYYDALERFALASHDLDMADKQKYAAHLRLACTYCRLERYDDAYQETLLALHDQHKTDTSLQLNDLLQQMRSEIGGTEEAQARRTKLAAEIDTLVTKAMADLV